MVKADDFDDDWGVPAIGQIRSYTRDNSLCLLINFTDERIYGRLKA